MRAREFMRQVMVAALCCVVAAAGTAGPPIPRSLFCRTFTEQADGNLAGPVQLWAAGSNMHAVMLDGGRLVHALQLGDTLFTWIDGDREGRREHLGTGLASYGLIRQIERVRNLGTWDGEIEVEGIRYERYLYTGTGQVDGNQYEEHAAVSFDSRSGAPKVWISDILMGGSGTVARMTIYFRDVEINVTMPIDIFQLPDRVEFTESD